MATSKSASIEVVNSLNSRFTNANSGDLIMCTSTNTQSIIIGTNTSLPSSIVVHDIVTINGTLAVNGPTYINRVTALSDIFSITWQPTQDLVANNAFIDSTAISHVPSLTSSTLPSTDISTIYSNSTIIVPTKGIYSISYSIGLYSPASLVAYCVLDRSNTKFIGTSSTGTDLTASFTCILDIGQVLQWYIGSSAPTNALMNHKRTSITLALVHAIATTIVVPVDIFFIVTWQFIIDSIVQNAFIGSSYISSIHAMSITSTTAAPLSVLSNTTITIPVKGIYTIAYTIELYDQATISSYCILDQSSTRLASASVFGRGTNASFTCLLEAGQVLEWFIATSISSVFIDSSNTFITLAMLQSDSVFVSTWTLVQDTIIPNGFIDKSSISYIPLMSKSTLTNHPISTIWTNSSITVPVSGLYTISYTISLDNQTSMESYCLILDQNKRILLASTFGTDMSASVTCMMTAGQVIKWYIGTLTPNAYSLMNSKHTFISLSLVKTTSAYVSSWMLSADSMISNSYVAIENTVNASEQTPISWTSTNITVPTDGIYAISYTVALYEQTSLVAYILLNQSKFANVSMFTKSTTGSFTCSLLAGQTLQWYIGTLSTDAFALVDHTNTSLTLALIKTPIVVALSNPKFVVIWNILQDTLINNSNINYSQISVVPSLTTISLSNNNIDASNVWTSTTFSIPERGLYSISYSIVTYDQTSLVAYCALDQTSTHLAGTSTFGNSTSGSFTCVLNVGQVLEWYVGTLGSNSLMKKSDTFISLALVQQFASIDFAETWRVIQDAIVPNAFIDIASLASVSTMSINSIVWTNTMITIPVTGIYTISYSIGLQNQATIESYCFVPGTVAGIQLIGSSLFGTDSSASITCLLSKDQIIQWYIGTQSPSVVLMDNKRTAISISLVQAIDQTKRILVMTSGLANDTQIPNDFANTILQVIPSMTFTSIPNINLSMIVPADGIYTISYSISLYNQTSLFSYCVIDQSSNNLASASTFGTRLSASFTCALLTGQQIQWFIGTIDPLDTALMDANGTFISLALVTHDDLIISTVAPIFTSTWQFNQNTLIQNNSIDSTFVAYAPSISTNNLNLTSVWSGTTITVPARGIYTISYSIGMDSQTSLVSYCILDGSVNELALTSVFGTYGSASFTCLLDVGQKLQWYIGTTGQVLNASISQQDTSLCLALLCDISIAAYTNTWRFTQDTSIQNAFVDATSVAIVPSMQINTIAWTNSIITIPVTGIYTLSYSISLNNQSSVESYCVLDQSQTRLIGNSSFGFSSTNASITCLLTANQVIQWFIDTKSSMDHNKTSLSLSLIQPCTTTIRMIAVTWQLPRDTPITNTYISSTSVTSVQSMLYITIPNVSPITIWANTNITIPVDGIYTISYSIALDKQASIISYCTIPSSSAHLAGTSTFGTKFSAAFTYSFVAGQVIQWYIGALDQTETLVMNANGTFITLALVTHEKTIASTVASIFTSTWKFVQDVLIQNVLTGATTVSYVPAISTNNLNITDAWPIGTIMTIPTKGIYTISYSIGLDTQSSLISYCILDGSVNRIALTSTFGASGSASFTCLLDVGQQIQWFIGSSSQTSNASILQSDTSIGLTLLCDSSLATFTNTWRFIQDTPVQNTFIDITNVASVPAMQFNNIVWTNSTITVPVTGIYTLSYSICLTGQSTIESYCVLDHSKKIVGASSCGLTSTNASTTCLLTANQVIQWFIGTTTTDAPIIDHNSTSISLSLVTSDPQMSAVTWQLAQDTFIPNTYISLNSMNWTTVQTMTTSNINSITIPVDGIYTISYSIGINEQASIYSYCTSSSTTSSSAHLAGTSTIGRQMSAAFTCSLVAGQVINWFIGTSMTNVVTMDANSTFITLALIKSTSTAVVSSSPFIESWQYLPSQYINNAYTDKISVSNANASIVFTNTSITIPATGIYSISYDIGVFDQASLVSYCVVDQSTMLGSTIFGKYTSASFTSLLTQGQVIQWYIGTVYPNNAIAIDESNTSLTLALVSSDSTRYIETFKLTQDLISQGGLIDKSSLTSSLTTSTVFTNSTITIPTAGVYTISYSIGLYEQCSIESYCSTSTLMIAGASTYGTCTNGSMTCHLDAGQTIQWFIGAYNTLDASKTRIAITSIPSTFVNSWKLTSDTFIPNGFVNASDISLVSNMSLNTSSNIWLNTSITIPTDGIYTISYSIGVFEQASLVSYCTISSSSAHLAGTSTFGRKTNATFTRKLLAGQVIQWYIGTVCAGAILMDSSATFLTCGLRPA